MIVFLKELKQIDPVYFATVLIPLIIILIMKFTMEKVWFQLNKKSLELFNVRLLEFKDIKTLKKLYKKTKDIHAKKFRNMMVDIIRKSSILKVILGIFCMFLVSSFFPVSREAVVLYMIILGFVWLILSLFLTIFEKTICGFFVDIIEAHYGFRKKD